MKYVAIIPIIIGLCACSQNTCPVKRDWTTTEQIEIAKEHNKLPADSILRGVMQEWENTRRQLN